MSDELTVRAAMPEDLPACLGLLQRSMGRAEDERFDTLFRWKHLENVFGPSPMWVACADTQIVGLRAFMRWEFERGDQIARCVRAVDTATHPDYQGRGIFRRLTLDALPTMMADGVQFVFNTPNTQSRPGYLKMGWREIGRASALVRPFSLAAGFRLARSRVPATHWSEPADFGAPVAEVLADAGFAALLASRPADRDHFRTRGDHAYFSWRYGMPLLRYRAVVAPGGVSAGVAFLRLRRRGAAREAVLGSVVVPGSARHSARVLLREVRRNVKRHADYILGVGSMPGGVRVPSFGPIMTTRDLATHAPSEVSAFDLSLGDLELF